MTQQAEETGAAPAMPVERDEDYPNPVYAWYVVAVLLVAYVFSFMDRQIINLLVEPIKKDMDLTDVQMSLILGLAFALFHTTFGIPIGWLVDRTKRMNVAAFGVFFWSLMTALTAFSRNFWHLFFYRAGVGVGEATLQPAAYSIITDYFPARRRGLAMSVFNLGTAIGVALAMIIGAQIISFVADAESLHVPFLGEMRSWQIVFLIVGLPGILVAVWVWTLREPIRLGARMSRDAEGNLQQSNVSFKEFVTYVRRIWVPFFMVTLSYSLIAMGGYAHSAWMPTFYIRTHEFTAVEIGRWMGVLSLIFGISGIVMSGWLSDFLIRKGLRNGRMTMLALSGILAAPFMLAYPLVPNPYVSLSLLGPLFLATAITSATWGTVVMEIMPNQMRGISVAVAILISSLLGLGMGPTAVALVTDKVFGDPQMLRYSLAIVPTIIFVLSSVLGYVAVRTYGQGLKSLDLWNAENAKQQV